jgi:hypothetical protein
MKLSERYDAAKAESAQCAQQYQAGRDQLVQIERRLIQIDAELRLLDMLIKEQAPVLSLVPDLVEGGA